MRPNKVRGLVAAGFVLIFAGYLWGAAGSAVTPAATVVGSDPLADQLFACRADLAVAHTNAEKAWASICARLAQRAIDAAATPTPSPSPSGSPTASPSTSPTDGPTDTPTPSPTVTPPNSSPPASPTPSSSPGPETCISTDPGAPGGPDNAGGCWPGPATTGVPAGYPLTAQPSTTIDAAWVSANQTHTIDGWDVQGELLIRADNITLTNTRIHCTGTATSPGDCLHNYASGFRGSWLDIGPDSGTIATIGIMDGGPSGSPASRNIYRNVNLHGTGDGLRCDGGFSLVDSWGHGLALGGGVHSDGCQALNVGGMLFHHNVIEGGNTSCFLLQSHGPGLIEISGNLLLGVHGSGEQTSYALNVDGHTVPAGSVTFASNVLNRDWQVGPFSTQTIGGYVFTPTTWHDNAYTNGEAIPIQ